MSTQFKLTHIPGQMYDDNSYEDRKKLRYEMAKMAQERGIKPTARYFRTYPAMVRKWLKFYETELSHNSPKF